MSITIFRQTAGMPGLQDQGVPAFPLTEPPCHLSGVDVALAGAPGVNSGVWACTPGRFERQLSQAEVMHLLAGAGTFTPTGGEALPFAAGDTLFFPAHTTGVWHITETLRKVFVILPHASAAPA